jgi:3-oxoacyl-[acyl-carrier-protein] synthase-3
MTSDQVDLLIPHQANIRIIQSAAKRLHIPMEKVFVNIEKYANTSGASIPIAMDEANRGGRIHHDDVVLLAGFGAGLTWAGLVAKWF